MKQITQIPETNTDTNAKTSTADQMDGLSPSIKTSVTRFRFRFGRSILSGGSFVSGLVLTLSGAYYSNLIPSESLKSIAHVYYGEMLPRWTGYASVISEEAQASNFAPITDQSTQSAKTPALPTGQVSDQAMSPVLQQATGAASAFDRELVLKDYQNRIADDFAIPEELRERVAFWFDVYTKYDDNKRVIHHSRYPWIVFKVVDVEPIINSDTPRRRWMRNEKADKFVKSELAAFRKALSTIATKGEIAAPNEYQTIVLSTLKPLGGNIKKQASAALADIRIQTGQKNFFIEGLEVSPRYLGTMEKIFKSYKLPIELTRIPFVESSFKQHATSKVGASGIWQFMGNTGRKFMLVNDQIDERRSPFKATEGAARLLKENHMILYRKWPLAITAWNHGPSGVRRALQAAGSRELGVIVGKYRSKTFDFASSNFYSEFLAALHAERYNDQIFASVIREEALSLEEVKLSRKVRLRDLLRVSGLSQERFLLLNPELEKALRQNASLPLGFRIHVPAQARNGIDRLLVQDTAKTEDRS